MELTVVVHPVDVGAHPTCPTGFRWAVHHGSDFADLSSCLNAGWQAERMDAAVLGEAARVVGMRAVQRCGIPVETPPTVFLESDPIPAGGDLITFA